MQNSKRPSPNKIKSPAGKAFAPDRDAEYEFPLGKLNFILMGISLLLIIVGFFLTSGSPSGLEEFNPDIFSVRRIVVGPALCFIGFVLMAVAIIVKPKDK